VDKLTKTINTTQKTGNSMDLKKQTEAILFSCGRTIELEELAKLIRSTESSVKKELRALQKEYDTRESPIMLIEEGTAWKMSVREAYLKTVRKITPYMEFSKTIMETLAVVAWKQPILQADVIKIRTNKAYEHIAELEKMGFLAKERHGRSFLLKLSQKFYDYFDLRDDMDVRNLFKKIKDVGPAQTKVDEFEVKEEKGETEVTDELETGPEPEQPIIEDEIETKMPEVREQDAVPEPDEESD